MSAAHACVDLDDTDALLEADRQGLLRASAMAGAQVRATAAAVDEGALEPVAGGARPRTLVWVAGRGPAASAGAILAATLAGAAAEPLVLAAESPSWVGPLDVVVVAGDDPGDPVLVTAAATAARRGARLVVAAPYEGPLRDATAARAAVLAPRVWVPDDFRLCGYLAAGLAVTAGRAGRRRDANRGMTPPIWPHWPTNSTRRRCATAPAGRFSPTPPRLSPSGCRAGGRCWPATARPPWHWPGTARGCCCG